MKAALAIARRDLVRYFTNPTGYVFILVFILLCSFAQFLHDQFFQENLATLGPLNEWFPWILVFFIPAVAMGAWADERRQGTEELLLTMPTPDASIVAGKYLSILGIYTVSLLFALSYVGILRLEGRPDAGIMFGTFFAYWLLGAGLLGVAMVGSLLSESVTVGFILGAVFCAVPVALGYFKSFFGKWLSGLGVQEFFRDLTNGVVTLEAVGYFASMAAIGVALTYYLLAQRRDERISWHYPVRTASFLLAAVATVVLAGRSGARVDVTAERLHSLSATTRETLRSLSADRPVLIQAYVSTEVPKDYVQTRENLLALLREVDRRGGDAIQLQVHEMDRPGPVAREAQEKYGIRAVRLMSLEEGEGSEAEVFLGAAFTSGPDEVVVPFFYRGLSIEYEVTRSIRVVTGAKRRKIGVLSTDANWFGGFSFETMSPSPPWPIVEELRKQYEVVSVSPDAEITEAVDVLIAPMPSTLAQAKLDNLAAYVKTGKPVLLLDDPLPLYNPSQAPSEAKRPRGGMMMGGAPPEPKGDIRGFFRSIGIQWNPDEIVWDPYNPHPGLRNLPYEVVFVGAGSGAPDAFNPRSPITSGLQEVVYMAGGRVRDGGVEGITFEPLLRAGTAAGSLTYDKVWSSNPFFGGGGFNPRRVHRRAVEGADFHLAAKVTGKVKEIPPPPPAPEEGSPPPPPSPETSVNVLFLADIDLISEQFIDLRRAGREEFSFDNVTLVLNCVDALAGDQGFLDLRKRRPRHRTLVGLEEEYRRHDQHLIRLIQDAEDKAEEKQREAQARFDEKVKAVEARTDLDERTKTIHLASFRDAEQRRLDLEKARIDDEKNLAIARGKDERKAKVQAIHDRVRFLAFLLPPIPVLIIGLVFFIRKVSREMEARR